MLEPLGAGPMQAPGLFEIADKRGKYGMVHNIGLGGAAVVSLLRRPEFFREGGEDGRNRCDPNTVFPGTSWYLVNCTHILITHRLGYNHAHECRPVNMTDVNKVKSKHTSDIFLQQAKL